MPLGLFILFPKLPVVLSNVPGPRQAQLERLHPGQDTSGKKTAASEGRRKKPQPQPQPSLLEGARPLHGDEIPSAATVTPTAICRKLSLASLFYQATPAPRRPLALMSGYRVGAVGVLPTLTICLHPAPSPHAVQGWLRPAFLPGLGSLVESWGWR